MDFFISAIIVLDGSSFPALIVVAQLFIVPAEMAYYGRWMYEAACLQNVQVDASTECQIDA